MKHLETRPESLFLVTKDNTFNAVGVLNDDFKDITARVDKETAQVITDLKFEIPNMGSFRGSVLKITNSRINQQYHASVVKPLHRPHTPLTQDEYAMRFGLGIAYMAAMNMLDAVQIANMPRQEWPREIKWRLHEYQNYRELNTDKNDPRMNAVTEQAMIKNFGAKLTELQILLPENQEDSGIQALLKFPEIFYPDRNHGYKSDYDYDPQGNMKNLQSSGYNHARHLYQKIHALAVDEGVSRG